MNSLSFECFIESCALFAHILINTFIHNPVNDVKIDNLLTSCRAVFPETSSTFPCLVLAIKMKSLMVQNVSLLGDNALCIAMVSESINDRQ